MWWDLALQETYTVLKEIYDVPDKEFRKRMAFLNEVLELNDFIKDPVRTLSLGQRMRADIAASLLHNPKVLFLDEPTIGLDVSVKDNIRRAITQINQEEETTILLTTHDLSDIEQLCHRIFMIDRGQEIFDGTVSQLKETFGKMKTLSFDLRPGQEHISSSLIGKSEINIKRNDLVLDIQYDSSRYQTADIIQQTLADFSVRDLKMTDADIEDIIRRFYRNGAIRMNRIWRRYKPFISTGIQGLITYRVDFILYRIGDVIGAFVAFYLWKAVFDSSSQSLIQGFQLSDMILYIIMSFVTNLLTRTDSSFMIGDEVKDGSIIMRLLRPVHFAASYLFMEIGSRWLIFLSIGVPFLLVITGVRLFLGTDLIQAIVLVVFYIISIILAFLINFFFNICFGFSAFVFKNLWGSNLLKNSLVAFMSGSLIPLTFFPKIVADILGFLPFSSLIYTPVMIIIGKYDGSQIVQALLLQIFWLIVMVALSQLIWKKVQSHITIQGG